MAFTQHNLFPCMIGGEAIGVLDELNVDPKIGLEIQRAAGTLSPVDAFVSEILSETTLKTPDLTAILDTLAIGLTEGLLLDTSVPSLFQYRQRLAGGWVDDDDHFVIKSYKGFVFVERIEVSQGDKKKAIATLVHHALADDNGNYLEPLAGQALDGAVGMTDYGYALGPLFIDLNGSPVQLDGNMKMTFESGIKFEPRPVAGELVARQGTTTAVMPKLTFGVVEMLDLLTWGLNSTYVENVTQYLVAIDQNGRRVAPNTASHLAITLPTAKLVPAKVPGGTDNSDSNIEYEAIGLGDVVNVTVGVALP